MFSRKIFGIMIILLLAAGVAITTTRCYDDDKDARVTIHLERNDLAAMGIQPKKHFIDRVLEFFSTRAEAGGWQDIRTNDLTLTISGHSYEDKVFTLPSGTTTYSISVPPANDLTITATHEYWETYSGPPDAYEKNWGGEIKIDLGPGDHEVSIQMKPMTWITNVSVATGLLVSWYSSSIHSSVSSYNLYRSLSIDGPYTKIYTSPSSAISSYTDTATVVGTRYYYRLSTNSTYGEGVMSDQKNQVR